MNQELFPAEEAYHSASDEDFNPDAPAADQDNTELSSEDEKHVPSQKGRRVESGEQIENADLENSGDEATIQKGRKKKRKLSRQSQGEDSEEGAEGGLVKTRAQRKAEVREKKPLMKVGKSSVDVNSLWSQMSGPSQPSEKPAPGNHHVNDTIIGSEDASQNRSSDQSRGKEPELQDKSEGPTSTTKPPSLINRSNGESTVTIKRKYDFAGQVMEEEKIVPASSAEAKLYLASQTNQETAGTEPNYKPPLRRPTRKKAAFPNLDTNPISKPGPAKPQKLTTLEKSKFDWAAHVDKEGISDELDEHSRAKEGYLGRMDFLGRMDAKRDQGLKK